MGKGKNWSKEEEEYLANAWGVKSVGYISKVLGRTEKAIMNKKIRMHLGRYELNGDYITYNVLIKALGFSTGGYRTKSMIKNRKLPVKRKLIKEKRIKVIYIEDFWKWAFENRYYLNFQDFEENLLGVEPAWVKEKRINDQRTKVNKEPWTKTEDEKLTKLLKEYKYDYRELSEILNRTEGAISRRIIFLGLMERPVKNRTRLWTKEEEKLLIEMIEEGLNYKIISNRLNRSEKSTKGKVGRMFNTENLDKARRLYREKNETSKETNQGAENNY